MGEVINLRHELAARAEKASDATTLSDWRIIPDSDRRLVLPDPNADLAALPLAPLLPVDVVAARQRQILAELDEPAGREGAARAVDALFKIKKVPGPDVIRDEIEFNKAMIGALEGYSSAVLMAALRTVLRSPGEWVPVAGVIVQLCEEEVTGRRTELRALARVEDERRRRRESEAEAEGPAPRR